MTSDELQEQIRQLPIEHRLRFISRPGDLLDGRITRLLDEYGLLDEDDSDDEDDDGDYIPDCE